MSATSTPTDSPIQPMHNPSQAAQVVVPQAPLGNATNGPVHPAAKAMFAKRFAKGSNPTFVSPTDNFMTPVSQKLSAAKKNHFNKGSKPMPSLFQQKEQAEAEADSDEDEADGAAPPAQPAQEPSAASSDSKMDEDENPF